MKQTNDNILNNKKTTNTLIKIESKKHLKSTTNIKIVSSTQQSKLNNISTRNNNNVKLKNNNNSLKKKIDNNNNNNNIFSKHFKTSKKEFDENISKINSLNNIVIDTIFDESFEYNCKLFNIIIIYFYKNCYYYY
jgi:hypothetical protein